MFDYQSLSPRMGEQEFVVERQFTAPRTLMFQVFTQPEHLKRWWAPQPYTLPVCTIDLRPGGIWHYCMRSPEDQDQWARSVYREIVPPEKLVYTSTYADEHANPIEGMPEHLTTVIFTEESGKTQVSAHVQFASAAALKVAVDLGMLQGMSMTWDYLIGYVQELHSNHSEEILMANSENTQPMHTSTPDPALGRLEKLVGTWELKGRTLNAKEDNITGWTTFEWMPGGFFLKSVGEINFHGSGMQSLEIIAYDPERKTFLSSVYSSMSGIVLSYEWDVQGDTVIHSGLGATYTGTFSEDGKMLSGGWRPDEGTERTDGTAYDATMVRVEDRK